MEALISTVKTCLYEVASVMGDSALSTIGDGVGAGILALFRKQVPPEQVREIEAILQNPTQGCNGL